MTTKHIGLAFGIIVAVAAGGYMWTQAMATAGFSSSEAQLSPAAASAPVPLEGTTFKLIAFDGQAVEGDMPYTVMFQNGALSGHFCNTFSGGYTLSDGRLTASLASTKMYCGEPMELMGMESALMQALAQGAALVQAGSYISISDGGEHSLIFQAIGAAQPVTN